MTFVLEISRDITPTPPSAPRRRCPPDEVDRSLGHRRPQAAGDDPVARAGLERAIARREHFAFETTLSGLGYRVRRNDPYAGGYVTRHYGRPREGVHALQVEVSRPLYMDEIRIERLPRMAALQADITRMIAGLTAANWSGLR